MNISYIVRACMVYCTGDLLRSVQLSGIFSDSKYFVDMPMTAAPEVITQEFKQLNITESEPEKLKSFIGNFFLEPGSDLLEWIPSDYNNSPDILSKITDSDYKSWAKELNDLWLVLGRKLNISVYENPERHSYLLRKHPFIVPGGRFRETYYWDSWWIIQGLLVCDMHETALNVISNLLDDVKNFGFVPNGGRIYYLDRSQPPVLSEIVVSYFRYIKSKFGLSEDLVNFLDNAYQILNIEYNWWMDIDNGHAINVGDSFVLNRYYSQKMTPRPESYKEDFHTVESAEKSSSKSQIYQYIRAGAESGWDFSSRWIRKVQGNYSLVDIHCSEIIPIDLNAIFYRFELNLAMIAETLDSTAQYNMHITSMKSALRSDATRFRSAAESRENAINTLMWNKEKALWLDFNLTSSSPTNSDLVSIASWIPLWAGLSDELEEENIVNSLINSKLLQPGGILTTSINSGQQWDSPNAWAPLVLLTVQGLKSLRSSTARKLSVRKYIINLMYHK